MASPVLAIAAVAVLLLVSVYAVRTYRPGEAMAAGPAPPRRARARSVPPLAGSGAFAEACPAQPAAREPSPFVPADTDRDGPTGQLYAGPRAGGVGARHVYGADTAYGDKWAMREFSTGVAGEVGVDVGPRVRAQPPAPQERDPVGDFYDPEAEGVSLGYGGRGPSAIRVPDHDPLTQ